MTILMIIHVKTEVLTTGLKNSCEKQNRDGMWKKQIFHHLIYLLQKAGSI